MAIVERPRDAALLVTEYVDPNRAPFQRPPGGTVEFGELATDAAVRELREEFDIELVEPELLGVIENRFEHDGRDGHEVVLVVRGRLGAPDRYEFEEIVHLDTDGVRGVWRPSGATWPQLVPNGIERFVGRPR